MGKAVLITGATSGIGLEMARELAGQHHNVLIASRSPDKLDAAADDIRSTHPQARVDTAELDLGDFADVRRFAGVAKQKMPVIDVLILNAGLYTHGLRKLDNGFEAMIGIMHLGHFLLFNLLLDQLKAADKPRVVVTSSVGHKAGKIDFDSFTDPQRHRISFFGYAQAKLANLLFAREAAKRYGEQGLRINAFHPGAVATGIWRELPGPLQWVVDKTMVSPEVGAKTGVWLAVDEAASDLNGEYCVGRRVADSSKRSQDAELAAELWRKSEQCCGLG